MKFYLVRPINAPQPVVYVATSEKAAHATGRDLFGRPPYSIDVVDLQVSAATIVHLLERVDPERLRGKVFAGEKLTRVFPLNEGTLYNGDPLMYEVPR